MKKNVNGLCAFNKTEYQLDITFYNVLRIKYIILKCYITNKYFVFFAIMLKKI